MSASYSLALAWGMATWSSVKLAMDGNVTAALFFSFVAGIMFCMWLGVRSHVFPHLE